MNIPLALISLAVGYKVFIDATADKNGPRRSFGRIVGMYVMILSFALSLAPLVQHSCLVKGGGCPLMGKMKHMR